MLAMSILFSGGELSQVVFQSPAKHRPTVTVT
jgi:hypothetical protein